MSPVGPKLKKPGISRMSAVGDDRAILASVPTAALDPRLTKISGRSHPL